MTNLIDMMYMVLPRPGMYLGKSDIHLFEIFYHGFALARSTREECEFMAKFEQHVRSKYKKVKTPHNIGWGQLFVDLAAHRRQLTERLNEYLSEDKVSNAPDTELALKIFKEEWEAYLEATPKDQWPYEPERAASQKPYRSIDEPWQDSTKERLQKKNPQHPHRRQRQQVEKNPTGAR